MDIEYFKDKILELLSEAENMDISDIAINDKENIFKIFFRVPANIKMMKYIYIKGDGTIW